MEKSTYECLCIFLYTLSYENRKNSFSIYNIVDWVEYTFEYFSIFFFLCGTICRKFLLQFRSILNTENLYNKTHSNILWIIHLRMLSSTKIHNDSGDYRLELFMLFPGCYLFSSNINVLNLHLTHDCFLFNSKILLSHKKMSSQVRPLETIIPQFSEYRRIQTSAQH